MMDNYERISLDDYVQSGEGGTALSYNSKDGKTLAKLFMKGYGAETAEREFRTSQAVYRLGIPSPRPVRLVTDGERYGGEYELIPGKRSYARIISEEPEQLEPLSLKFAALAKELHATPADTSVFPEMNASVRFWMEKSENISEPLRARLLSALDSIPSPACSLHGDLHIGNIITDGRRDLWIDLGDFAYGCPEWDFSMIFFVANYMTQDRTQQLFHLDPAVLRTHWSLLVKAYYGFRDDEQLHGYERNLLKFVALKLYYNFCKRHDGKGSPSPQLEGLAGAFWDGVAPRFQV